MLIAGRSALGQRCHRCGKLLISDPRVIRDVWIGSYYSPEVRGGRHVTCLAHPFQWHPKPRFPRLRVWLRSVHPYSRKAN